jgi:GrpB-like predicted nucleotidyltransferase (UPF0157 family)
MGEWRRPSGGWSSCGAKRASGSYGCSLQACFLRLVGLLPDPRQRRGIEVLERLAEGVVAPSACRIVTAEVRQAIPAGSVSAVLGPVLVRVKHVGSTSVPGLPAKPVIDLDVVVRPADVSEAVRLLSGLGYAHLGNRGVTGREAFAAPAGTPAHHLYVCPVGNPVLVDHLRFRDFLRADAKLAAEYALLKRQLAVRFGPTATVTAKPRQGLFVRPFRERQTKPNHRLLSAWGRETASCIPVSFG